MSVSTITLQDDYDRRLVVGALRASLTYTLDALAASINNRNAEAVVLNVKHRARVRRLLAEAGADPDDSFRMTNIARHAAGQDMAMVLLDAVAEAAAEGL